MRSKSNLLTSYQLIILATLNDFVSAAASPAELCDEMRSKWPHTSSNAVRGIYSCMVPLIGRGLVRHKRTLGRFGIETSYHLTPKGKKILKQIRDAIA